MKKAFCVIFTLCLALSCLVLACCGTKTAELSRGSMWLSGTGIPQASDGAAGDYYLDFETGSVYEKTAEGWTVRGNLRNSSAETVTVTFDAGEGKLPEGYLREAAVPKGGSLALPIPVREGYRFLGWFYGNGANRGQANDLTVFARDILLTAEWHKLLVLTVTPGAEQVYVGEGLRFTGFFEGKARESITVYVEKGGQRYPAEECEEWIEQCYVQFTPDNGALQGILTFCAAGEYRIVVCAEENGEQAEVSFSVSVREEI